MCFFCVSSWEVRSLRSYGNEDKVAVLEKHSVMSESSNRVSHM